MTAQDIHILRGQLLADLERATQELGAQNERAYRFAATLRDAAERIEHSACAEPISGDLELEREMDLRLLPEHLACFNQATAMAILTELKKAREKVYELRRRSSLMSGIGAINRL